jgi:hypothetical protein
MLPRMARLPRRNKLQHIDIDAVARSLAEVDARHRAKVERARAELDAFMRRVTAELESAPQFVARLRQFTMRLEMWQVTAAKLLAAARGDSCQERMRDWITAGLVADWRALKRAARKRR